MKYTKQQIIEYAQLAQQCYNVPKEANQLPELPGDWKFVFFEQGSWDTFYVLYSNPIKNEIVLGIRGTDNLYNWLVNTSLVLGAWKGKHEEIPGTNRVKELAKKCLSNLGINAEEEAQRLSQAIGKLNQETLSINESVLSSVGATASSAELNSVNPLFMNTLSNDSLENQNFFKQTEELGKVLIDFKQHYFPDFTFRIVGHSLGGVIAELCAVEVGVECISFESPGSLERLEKLFQYKNKPHNVVNFLSAPNIINILYHHPGTIYRMKLPHAKDNSLYSYWAHKANCLMQTGSQVFTYASLGAGAVVPAALGIGAGLTSGALNISTDIDWLLRQHSIDNIVAYLSGEPQLVEMDSWPHIDLKSDLPGWLIKEFARDFVPLQKDKAGIRNLFDEEGMREARVQRIPGYKEKNANVSLLFYINEMRKELEEWKVKKQWLEQERRKYKYCQEEMAKLLPNGKKSTDNSSKEKVDNPQNQSLLVQTQHSSSLERWCSISTDFTEELVREWRNKNFTHAECADWININRPNQHAQEIQNPAYYTWLRDTKKLTPEWVLNHGDADALKREYQASQQTPQILQSPPPKNPL